MNFRHLLGYDIIASDNMTERQVALFGSIGLLWGDPKLTMTPQFPTKSYHRFFSDSSLRNKEKDKKEKEIVLF